MRSKIKHCRWVILLQYVQNTLGVRIPTITLERPRANYAPVMRSFSKRATSSKSVYIGILSGVLGAIVIVTVGICWNIQRRRLASKRRQLEEARHPRQPTSYDHFPVRPGDEPEPVTEPIRPQPAMMSVGPHQQAITLPLLGGTSRAAVTSPLAPLDSSFELGDSLITHPETIYSNSGHTHGHMPHSPISQMSWRDRSIHSPRSDGADIPQYEEATALPPPFFDSSLIIRPPGLGEDGFIPSDPTRPSISSSRPITASAPPAYTPSDTGHMTSSSHDVPYSESNAPAGPPDRNAPTSTS